MAIRVMTMLEAPLNNYTQCGIPHCSSQALFRCVDCDYSDLVCQKCLVEAHQCLPFHKIQRWNSVFFETTTLIDCGLVYFVNHGRQACPHVYGGSGPQEITIIDVNGIHQVAMGWCRCAGAPPFTEQLFLRHLFPASYQQPKIAFTFRVLKLFHMFNHVARTTPWDFAGAMNRLTDNADVCAYPVSLQETKTDTEYPMLILFP